MRNFLALATLTILLHLALAEDREKRSTHGYGGYDHYEYKKGIYCYQCAYSPPKTYYKTIKEYTKYGHSGEYGHGHGGYGDQGDHGSYGKHGGYVKEYKVPYTVYGGWDKCLKPFDHYEAKKFGIDVWECHGNCYIRKEKNGNVFRGCYKGEYKVDPYRLGCHWQQGALWCFCKGDKCNNGAVPYH